MAKWALHDDGIDIDALKEAIDIIDLMERYGVEGLRQCPTGIRGACPFCRVGKREPFSVNEDVQRYFCFHCHRKGSVIDFVMEMEGLTFNEAVSLLAEGKSIAPIDPQVKFARATMTRLRRWQDAQETPPGLGDETVPSTVPLLVGYRGLSVEAIDHFGLRRIPGQPDAWGTGIYLPFRNAQGVLIGYAIRQQREPRYLNSTGLQKGHFCYGLWENREAIREAGFAVLVEGQFDAIKTWDRGVKNVCALMGSHMTNHQANALMAYTSRLVIALDGDDAGRNGSKEIASTWSSSFDIEVLELESGQDPDSFDLSLLLGEGYGIQTR